MSKKKETKGVRYGSHEYMVKRQTEVLKQEARLSYKNKLKVYLSFSVKELKEMKHPLYDIVIKAFPTIDENATLDDARITRLLDSALRLGSIKAIEMTYKLDGSMSDLAAEPNYDLIEEETEGVK